MYTDTQYSIHIYIYIYIYVLYNSLRLKLQNENTIHEFFSKQRNDTSRTHNVHLIRTVINEQIADKEFGWRTSRTALYTYLHHCHVSFREHNITLQHPKIPIIYIPLEKDTPNAWQHRAFICSISNTNPLCWTDSS